jgi:hypothetical protein
MQICWRRVAFRETDHELLWLSISLTSLAAAAAWFALRLPWPQCVFHALTGHPCVTCGATRSTLQFFHGHFFKALQWNPLVFVVLCGVSIFDTYAATVLLMRAPRLRIAHITSVEKKLVRILLVALLALNWIYLLVANPSF